jgi:hypothetical protein
MEMKRFAFISTGLFICLVTVVTMHNVASASSGNQSNTIGIVCAKNTSERLWIEQQRDDDPSETGHLYFLASEYEPMLKYSLSDLDLKPVRTFMLNPFLTDRPPPDFPA